MIAEMSSAARAVELAQPRAGPKILYCDTTWARVFEPFPEQEDKETAMCKHCAFWKKEHVVKK